MHAAFAEQNPRGHAGMQARSIVLVTHALMKFKDVLEDTMAAFVKTHTGQGEGPTQEDFELRCLKDHAPEGDRNAWRFWHLPRQPRQQ